LRAPKRRHRVHRRHARRRTHIDDHRIVSTRVLPGPRARLIDVSATGALIETSQRLLPGTSVELHVETSDRRIERRTQQMLDLGFEAEVRTLCQKYGTDLPLLNTLGYAEMKPYLQGDCSLATAKREIILHTRQFAKRQRTWFRADPSIEWFDAEAPDLVDQVWQRVCEFGTKPSLE